MHTVGTKLKKWSQSDKQFILNNWNKMSLQEMGDHFKVSANAVKRVAGAMRRNGITVPYKKAGAATPTEGRIVVRTSKEKNTKYIYADGKWQILHVYVWKKHGGQIPWGWKLAFKDGDRMNCAHENLTLKKKMGEGSTGGNIDGRWHNKKFQTKLVDYSNHKSVRLDRKTVILVPPGANTNKILKQYQQLRHG